MNLYRSCVRLGISLAAALILVFPDVKAQDLEIPNLPLGEINLVVLTDVHSWLSGHGRKEFQLNADYGDVLSFYQRLKAYCDSVDLDLWFVMNGDWIDGTGLSLAGDASHLVPLIQKMPFDVVNTGNHELYKSEVVEEMRRPGGFIDWWGDRHLSSNIVMTHNQEPFSNKYKVLEGKHSNVLVFGFIYFMHDPTEELLVQDPVSAMAGDWFLQALVDETYDAILVMAHMGTDDESVADIRDAIRNVVGDSMPIQFVNGHTHVRRQKVVDDLSTAVEAGRYLDTVGFISFPSRGLAEGAGPTDALDLFQYVFLDANVNDLKYALGGEHELATADGLDLQTFIQDTRNSLGLDQKLGCVPQDYFLNRSLYAADSLWKIYQNQVVPSQLERDPNVNRAILIFQGSWRYDLFAGKNVYDDLAAVSPFDELVNFIGTMPCNLVLTLNDTLNRGADNFYAELPSYILSGTVTPDADCELYTHTFELPHILSALERIDPDKQFSPEGTNLTSLSIWTNFVQEKWPCDGDNGIHVHIPWLDDHAIINENGETDRKNLAVILAVAGACILSLCASLFLCWRVTRFICFGADDIPEEELDAIKDDFDMDAEFT